MGVDEVGDGVYDIYDYGGRILRKAESRSKQQPSRVDRA